MRPATAAAGRTCPYCRDDLEGATRTLRCRACKVVLHTECAGALERCPTLGCGRRLPAPLPDPRSLGGRAPDPVPWPPRPPAWERGWEERRPAPALPFDDEDLSAADVLTVLAALLGVPLLLLGTSGLAESVVLGRTLATLGACAVVGALLRMAAGSTRLAAPPLALLAAGGALWTALPAVPLGLTVAGLGAGWAGLHVLTALAEAPARR